MATPPRNKASIFTNPEFDDDDEGRAVPKGSTLVCDLQWSWGPAHGRSDTYNIEGELNEWTLWATTPNFDTGKPMNSIYASGRWDVPISKFQAAYELLLAAWKHEWSLYESPGPGFTFRASGLLAEKDLREIAEIAFNDEDDEE